MVSVFASSWVERAQGMWPKDVRTVISTHVCSRAAPGSDPADRTVSVGWDSNPSPPPPRPAQHCAKS